MTAQRVLSCREIVELVTAYLEGDLDADVTTALETHLDVCPGCARYVEQIRETVATLGDVSSDNLSTQAPESLLEAFRDFRRPTTDRPRQHLKPPGWLSILPSPGMGACPAPTAKPQSGQGIPLTDPGSRQLGGSGTKCATCSTERGPPARVPVVRPRKRSGSTVGRPFPSSSATLRSTTVRLSRTPRDLARLTRMENVQVRSDARPSKRSNPFSMPSQASCTLSSADWLVDTKFRASRSIAGDHARTS